MDGIRTNADMLTYARRVRYVLKKRKITQQDLAKFIDVPTSRIGRILNWKPGKYKINDNDRELVSLINNCLNLDPVNPDLSYDELVNLFSRIVNGGLEESDYDNIRYYLSTDDPDIMDVIRAASKEMLDEINIIRARIHILELVCGCNNIEDVIELLRIIKKHYWNILDFKNDINEFKEYLINKQQSGN